MNNDIAIGMNEYFQMMQGQMGAFATALSSSVKQYALTGEQLIINTEKSAQTAVDVYAKAYKDTASWAEAYAKGAAEASNTNAAAQMQKWAGIMNAKAAQLTSDSATALSKVDDITKVVNKTLSETISPAWRDIKGIGAVFDGFGLLTAALNGDIDSLANGGNADGKISNLDTQFTNLRIWRDLNQDGISQTGELFTLASLNIASINVASTAHSQTLANGNQIADIGSYTKTDGTQVAVGEVTGSLADVNLASDTFHRSFTDVLDTTSIATLPDMQGSGKVRDLREAANDKNWRIVSW